MNLANQPFSETPEANLKQLLTPEEYQLLLDLREISPAQNPPRSKLSLGDRVADKVAATMGSWPFILVQSFLLAMWITLNVLAFIKHWDPYPFILLNLALSFQAAYAAPFIMMSQNRQSSIDRQEAHHDYAVNTKAELEIEHIQEKLNQIQMKEIPNMVKLLEHQRKQLHQIETLLKEKINP
ncbi:MAG: DUF1003 domain-containing protein [Limnothrix sp. RL_2_0]|nr:DUF1003 domain-containing protein [Limnothrix sp. RL_2_0]